MVAEVGALDLSVMVVPLVLLSGVNGLKAFLPECRATSAFSIRVLFGLL